MARKTKSDRQITLPEDIYIRLADLADKRSRTVQELAEKFLRQVLRL